MAGRCERCGGEIPEDGPFGLCPRCSLSGPEEGGAEGPEIPGYEVVRTLGTGGFGEVYECVQLNPAVRCVAVKVLKVADEAERRRLEDEIQVLGELSHPGIARLLGCGELPDGRPFHAMELCEGVPFDEWIAGERPPMRARVDVLRALAEAVAHAHERGVVHRDLTPRNVLVAARPGGGWQPKLIDFGLSRATLGPASVGREETLEARWAGTPLWMAPEQLAGREVGPAADLHALGLLLGFALLEKPPLSEAIVPGAGWGAWLEARKEWQWPARPRLARADRPLQWVAERELALDPGARSRDAGAFGDELDRWLDGRVVRAGRGRTFYEVSRTLARHPRVVAAVVLATVAVVAAGLAWRSAERSGRESGQAALEAQARAAEADRLHALAVADLQVGRADEALRLLDDAARLDPDNPEVEFSRAALGALAPVPEELAPLELPWVAKRVASVDGAWAVESFEGARLRVAEDGSVAEWSGPFPEDPEVWRDPEGRWEARRGEGGRLVFEGSDDGFPPMHPLRVGEGRVALDGGRGRVVATTDGPRLKRWDMGAVGGTRETARFERPVVWMAFERDDADLWMRQENGRMRGWMRGDAPGFAVDMPVFSPRIDGMRIGENHARGTRPGWGGAAMLVSLEAWRRGKEGRELRAVAGARDVDHLAFAGSGGFLLWWVPGKPMLRWETGLPEAELVSVNGAGTQVLWCAEDGRVWWLDPDRQAVVGEATLPSAPASASLLDPVGGIARAVVGGTDGVARVFRPEGGVESEFRAAGERPGPHRTRVHGLQGGAGYLVAIEGGLEVRGIDAVTGEPSGEPMRFDRGVGDFFLSQDGGTLVAVDQAATGPGLLRLMSLRTRRDLLPPLRHPARITWAVISSRGDTLATACADGTVRRWVLGED